MKNSRVITLLTDFGQQGGFVSALKGVILSINPNVQLVDITHEIQPQNVFEAAFTLLVNYRYFPKDSIHVAVVDPGVGSKRKIMCARTQSGIFIGPDNGIFTPILDREKKIEVFEINNPKIFLPVVSNTFHGRDKMAPAAAYLAGGFPVQKVGPKIAGWTRINFDRPKTERNRIKGCVINIDRFGNAITNITGEDVSCIGDIENLKVQVKGKTISSFTRFFSEVPKGALLAIVGSSNFVEVAQNLGSAAKTLKIKVGDSLEVVKK